MSLSICPHDKGLDTGDIVLFDRPCFKMGSFVGAAVCIAAKTVSGCPFDHVGVVVSDKAHGSYPCTQQTIAATLTSLVFRRHPRSNAISGCVSGFLSKKQSSNITGSWRERS